MEHAINKPIVLVIDDDDMVNWTIKEKLNREGFMVKTVQNGAEGLEIIHKEMPDLAFIDIFLPDISGIRILKEIKKINKEVPVIIMTASASVDKAVTAMKLGAYDYINKPFNINEIVLIAKKAVESDGNRVEISEQENNGKQLHGLNNIIGESDEMKEVLEMARKVSKSDTSTVLIQGESGTGKDLIARTIHYSNKRAGKPFMDINCTAMPDTLVESELFGFEKGAFTDAKSKKKGLFELADGGSVLLDEIGDVPLATQAKLLKLIENKRFKRIGGSTDINVNIRIIAATNKDIKAKVKKGEFREDLYYRLKVFPIFIPPLRSRKSDIIPLARFYINKFNTEFGKKIKGLSSEAEKAFMAYNWPGNVRELKNVIERAIILEGKEKILIEHLPIEVVQDMDVPSDHVHLITLPKNGISLEKVERDFLIQAITAANGNQSKAAKLLRLSRWAFRYRINKFGITGSSKYEPANKTTT